jgi:hypothetical protein
MTSWTNKLCIVLQERIATLRTLQGIPLKFLIHMDSICPTACRSISRMGKDDACSKNMKAAENNTPDDDCATIGIHFGISVFDLARKSTLATGELGIAESARRKENA